MLVDQQFQLRPWRRLRVGDIVRLEANSFIPADIVLISSSEPEGLCYVETANLDGSVNFSNTQLSRLIIYWDTEKQIWKSNKLIPLLLHLQTLTPYPCSADISFLNLLIHLCIRMMVPSTFLPHTPDLRLQKPPLVHIKCCWEVPSWGTRAGCMVW